MKVPILLLMCLVMVSQAEVAEEATKEIHLKQGIVQGVKQEARNSRIYYSFRGIPFAEPPTGDLRLKDPVPAGPWTGVRTPFEAPLCPQQSLESLMVPGSPLEITGEEDCLYLNVYTPRPFVSNLPVMVWIHGGGYFLGSADMFGGTSPIMLSEEIVLVSVQYRLGILGFISTEDKVLPGNLGLKDQTLALRWVQENIRQFGGDPTKVTIFGESAGGGSVHQQILIPQAKGLFNRVIMQSGCALSPWSLRNDHRAVAGEVAKKLSCPESCDSATFLECLQKASVDDLLRVQTSLPIHDGIPFHMVPRVDGDVLPAHPAQLLKEGRYHKVDLILGVTKDESAGTVKMAFAGGPVALANHTPALLGLDHEENAEYLTHRAFYEYLDNTNVTHDDVEAYKNLMGDSFFNYGMDLSAQLHSRDVGYKNYVYRYQLDHVGPKSLLSGFADVPFGKDWVPHGDDLQYLFPGIMGTSSLERHQDIFLSNVMVKLWTNFAATGNPTPNMALGFQWKPLDGQTLSYLSLRPSPIMLQDPKHRMREFWSDMPTRTNEILFPEKFIRESCEGKDTSSSSDHCEIGSKWLCDAP